MANIRSAGYYPGDSILHTSSTQTKVLLAIILIFSSGLGNGFVLLTIALLCQLGMFLSKISILEAWKRLTEVKIFLLVLGGGPLFLTPGTQVYLLGELILPITVEGLEVGFFTVFRLVLMIWISMILVCTTSPESLVRIVTNLGLRFFPKNQIMQEFLLIGVLAFQTLPLLFLKVEQEIGRYWREGDKNPKKKNLLVISKEMVSSMITWTINALAESDRLVNQQKKP